MAARTPLTDSDQVDRGLPADFADRLELSLSRADGRRRRETTLRRLRPLLPLVLLVGPIVGWRLILTSPDGVHIGINALAWISFVLDVGVHVDTSILTYLGLQALPTIVGALLFILVAGLLLLAHRSET